MNRNCVTLSLFLGTALAGSLTSLAAQELNAGTFANLTFRQIGPINMSGRIVDIAVVESNPFTFYVASATGGVWKTTNAGTTFKPIFDKKGSYSIGCITMDPSNPHVIWVGTGEANNSRSSYWGNGIYKSIDGGETWTHLGLEETQNISRIRIHPQDCNTVWVAAFGKHSVANPERGVFK